MPCQNASIFLNILQYRCHNEKCMQIMFWENKFQKSQFERFPLFQFFFRFCTNFPDISTFSGIFVFSVFWAFCLLLGCIYILNGKCLWMQSCFFVYCLNSQGNHENFNMIYFLKIKNGFKSFTLIFLLKNLSFSTKFSILQIYH